MTAAYTDPAPVDPEALRLLRPADIDKIFKRSRGWFDHSRVRKRLNAKGFPASVDRGLWSAVAVANWLAGPGSDPANVPPDVRPMPSRRGPKRRRANGYVQP